MWSSQCVFAESSIVNLSHSRSRGEAQMENASSEITLRLGNDAAQVLYAQLCDLE